MTSRTDIALSSIIHEKFLREIHHFVWHDRHENQGILDQGWNCRDHAWLLALLAHRIGFQSVLFHGEACFIEGPKANRPRLVLHQNTHSWTGIEGLGSFDLSINKSIITQEGKWTLPLNAVYANSGFPKGRADVAIHRNKAEFDNAIRHMSVIFKKTFVVYLIKEIYELEQEHVKKAAQSINSPLTDELRKRYGNPTELYAALFIHLTEFLISRKVSLAGLTRWGAWDILAERSKDSVEHALKILQQKIPLQISE